MRNELRFQRAVLLSVVAVMSWYPSSRVSAQSGTWQTLVTTNFEVFYEPQAVVNLDRAVFEAERAYSRISLDLRLQLSERVPLILVSTASDLSRAQDAVQNLIRSHGALPRNHLLVSLEPSELLEGTLMHELTHQFQFEILHISPQTPPWVVEGMAEFERGRWMPSTVSPVRTSVVVPFVSRLTSADRDGGRAVFSYVADEFGTDGIRRYLYALRDSTNNSDALERAFGLTEEEFESQFNSYMRAY
jgi:hypothetical protein